MSCSIRRPITTSVQPAGVCRQVKTLGGEAGAWASAGFLRLFGGTDSFHIRVNGTRFGDEDLARLVQNYGKLIWGLDVAT